MSETTNKPLPGTAHPALEGSRAVGAPHADSAAEITLYLHSDSSRSDAATPEERYGTVHLSHDEYEAAHGASAQDIDRVLAFARDHGLTTVEVSSAKRIVRLNGTTEQLNRAFGVELAHYEHDTGRNRGHEGDVHLPEELHEVVVGVLGLDDREMSRRHPLSEADVRGSFDPGAPISPDNMPPDGHTPPQVAEAYHFPAHLDGEGQCIGIVELGGGYWKKDVDTYFSGLGIPRPEIVTVGPNRRGTRKKPERVNIEVALDIDVVGAIVPKAKLVLYFAEKNTGTGFVNIMNEAIHDRVNKPSVLSVSWGAPEVSWPESGANIMNQVIESAAALGVTVCIASGDKGAAEGLEDGRITPSFPASVPSALACGGTRLSSDRDQMHEVAWDNLATGGGATGGGISAFFPLPAYQAKHGVPPVSKKGAKPGFVGRGIPDVCGVADPHTGYLIYYNGEWLVKGGTSAVAPLWAALIAMMNQSLGRRVGHLAPLLYSLAHTDCIRTITKGNNGYYKAGPGWDACTGVGAPHGEMLLAAVEKALG